MTQQPEAPHVVNPRVPLAASLLCMKMLAERPEERFPMVATLCAALNESLSNAEHDAAWESPLVDPLDPQTTTTLDDPAKQEPNEQRRMFLKLAKRRPRRGQPSPNAAPVLFVPALVAGPRPPAAAANQDEPPKVDAPGVGAAPGEHEQPVKGAPVPPARELKPAAAAPPTPAAPRGAWGSLGPCCWWPSLPCSWARTWGDLTLLGAPARQGQSCRYRPRPPPPAQPTQA